MSSHFSNLLYYIPDLESRNILDLGSGKGKFLLEATRRGASIAGLEKNIQYINQTLELAKNNNVTLKILEGVAEKIPYTKESFSFVNMSELIEHVEDPSKVLLEVNKVLSANGLVYMSVPSRFSVFDTHYHLLFVNWLPRSWSDFYLKLFHKQKNYQAREAGRQRLSEMHYYTYKQIKELAEFSGFEIMDMREFKIKNKFANSFIHLPAKFLYKVLKPFYFETFHLLLSKKNNFWDDYTAKKEATSFPMEILEQYAGGNILDLGCGDGSHANQFQKLYSGELCAIDPSEMIIRKATESYPTIHFLAASAYSLPYPDDFFDLVYSIDVIEHLKTPEKMLAEVRRVMKPDAVVVFQTPNYPIKRFYDLYNFLSKNWRTNLKDDPTHFYKFTALNLKKMCAKYFRVIDFRTRNIFLENKFIFLKNKKNIMPWILFGQKTIIILKKIK